MASYLRAVSAGEQLDLAGRKGLVVGIADAESLAWSAAQYFHHAGAELAITYRDETAKPFVEPLARRLAAPVLAPCELRDPRGLDTVFDAIRSRWGRLDFLLHAVDAPRADDLRGRLIDSPAERFAESMLVSCHSLIRMARLAEPLMPNGGSLVTLCSFADKAVDNDTAMGPVTAALEAAVRQLAHELGPKGIRVNAISARAVKTREIGRAALLLASDYSTAMTGEVLCVDARPRSAELVYH